MSCSPHFKGIFAAHSTEELGEHSSYRSSRATSSTPLCVDPGENAFYRLCRFSPRYSWPLWIKFQNPNNSFLYGEKLRAGTWNGMEPFHGADTLVIKLLHEHHAKSPWLVGLPNQIIRGLKLFAIDLAAQRNQIVQGPLESISFNSYSSLDFILHIQSLKNVYLKLNWVLLRKECKIPRVVESSKEGVVGTELLPNQPLLCSLLSNSPLSTIVGKIGHSMNEYN